MAKMIFAALIVLSIGGLVGAYVTRNPSVFQGYDYEWQKNCDDHCAEVVGKARMAEIDAMGCGQLKMETDFAAALQKEEQQKKNTTDYWNFEENLLALRDRATFSNCP